MSDRAWRTCGSVDRVVPAEPTAVYSVVSDVSALTAPGPLSSQAANLNNSLAPDRPWLDLTYQLMGLAWKLLLPLVLLNIVVTAIGRLYALGMLHF